MKKIIIRVLAGMFLLAAMYFIATDAMMTMFGLSRGIQYAFNMGTIFILCPVGLYFLIGKEDEE